ncbi:MAG: thioredoxin family protein [Xanthobacteraceae bacterium]|nr:thioredoxin family protein [Xanthobacteraceae bacterium]
MQHPPIVSREDWIAARKRHLAREKELTRLHDEVMAERRALPWVRIEKDYAFDTPQGRRALAELFAGRSQLIVYHFMWRADLGTGCVGCSFLCDHVDGANLHLKHHDVTFVAVSRAPLAVLEAYRTRMGWRFDWASSEGSDFNFDFHVSFTKDQLETGKVYYNYEMTESSIEELPGLSVFIKDAAGAVFHTYSGYGRAGDVLLGAHNFLDFTPKGRNETTIMDWVRRHDEYEAAPQGCCGGQAAA